MPGVLRWVLALAGFALGFTLVWFTLLSIPPALAAGLILAVLTHRWALRLEARGPAPWALERLAMRLAFRRGAVTPDELARAAGVPRTTAKEVLDGLEARGLARREGGRYRF